MQCIGTLIDMNILYRTFSIPDGLEILYLPITLIIVSILLTRNNSSDSRDLKFRILIVGILSAIIFSLLSIFRMEFFIIYRESIGEFTEIVALPIILDETTRELLSNENEITLSPGILRQHLSKADYELKVIITIFFHAIFFWITCATIFYFGSEKISDFIIKIRKSS